MRIAETKLNKNIPKFDQIFKTYGIIVLGDCLKGGIKCTRYQ